MVEAGQPFALGRKNDLPYMVLASTGRHAGFSLLGLLGGASLGHGTRLVRRCWVDDPTYYARRWAIAHPTSCGGRCPPYGKPNERLVRTADPTRAPVRNRCHTRIGAGCGPLSDKKWRWLRTGVRQEMALVADRCQARICAGADRCHTRNCGGG